MPAGPTDCTLEDLFHEEVRLPAFPPVLAQLQDLLGRPSTNMADVARLVQTDPVLAARVLQLANSPLYRAGGGGVLTDLPRAVVLLGSREIQTLATASFAVSAFKDLPSEVVDMRRFWRHSLYTGLLTQALGDLGAVYPQGNLFVAGLLHDIGALLIYQQLPQWAAECIAASEAQERPLDEVERAALGFDHGTVGAVLLRGWGIPEPIAAAAEFHHRAPDGAEIPHEAAIVRVANALTGTLSDAYGVGFVPTASNTLWQAAGLDSATAGAALDQADEKLEQTQRALMGER